MKDAASMFTVNWYDEKQCLMPTQFGEIKHLDLTSLTRYDRRSKHKK